MKIRSIAFAIIVVISIAALYCSCTKEGAASTAASATTGKGGSLARFTIADNYLYAISNHYLYAYSLANPAKPEVVYTSPMNFDIETIYPYNKYLFLGTRTGLYIYSIDTPSSPRLIGQAEHARSCDPVVVNDTVAFVTLKSNSGCGPAVAGLYIHDVSNITQPVLKKMIPITDPSGMGLQDSILYVCCDSLGLKVFNIKSPYSPTLISTITDDIFSDVIPYNGILICYVQDGIILYDITDPALPVFIKKITN